MVASVPNPPWAQFNYKCESYKYKAINYFAFECWTLIMLKWVFKYLWHRLIQNCEDIEEKQKQCTIMLDK